LCSSFSPRLLNFKQYTPKNQTSNGPSPSLTEGMFLGWTTDKTHSSKKIFCDCRSEVRTVFLLMLLYPRTG